MCELLVVQSSQAIPSNVESPRPNRRVASVRCSPGWHKAARCHAWRACVAPRAVCDSRLGNLELTLHSHAPGLAGATASIVADRVDLQFWYDPESRNLNLEADNRLILQRPLNALVLAPSEVVIDTNRHFSIKEVSIR